MIQATAGRRVPGYSSRLGAPRFTLGQWSRPWARGLIVAVALILLSGLAGSSACYAQDVDEDGMPISRPVEQSEPPPEPEAQPQDDPGEPMAQDDPGEAPYQAGEEGQPVAEPEGSWLSSGEADAPEAGEAGYPPDGPAGLDQASSPFAPGETAPGSRTSAPPRQAPGAAPQAGGNEGPGLLDTPPTVWAIALAALAALAVSLLAAKVLMPWPRPRLSCAYDVAPASLLSGALTLHPPDVLVSAESTCGTPSIAGDLAIEEGSDADA